MDSVEFCGQVCHTVMEPEFVAVPGRPALARQLRASATSARARRGSCRSKLSGTRQVLAVRAEHVLHVRFRRRCTTCARRAKPASSATGPRSFTATRSRSSVSSPRTSRTPRRTMTMQIHVGGGSDRLGIATGIHWHMNVANEIEYIATDDKRQVIPWVQAEGPARQRPRVPRGRRHAGGSAPRGAPHDGLRRLPQPAEPPVRSVGRQGGEPRARDGRDSEDAAVRQARSGRGAERALPVTEAAEDRIAQRLREFYGQNYATLCTGHSARTSNAPVAGTQQLYRRNIFPAMNVTGAPTRTTSGTWTRPGCFRCHDDNHKSPGRHDHRPGLRSLPHHRMNDVRH